MSEITDSDFRKVIDWQELKGRLGDEEIVRAACLDFSENIGVNIDNLKMYYEQADFEGMSHLIHTIKGSTANISANQASAAAAAVEEVMQDGSEAELEKHFSNLMNELEKLESLFSNRGWEEMLKED